MAMRITRMTMTMMTTMIHMLPIMNLPYIGEFCQLVDEYEGRASRNGRWDRSWQKKDRLKCEVDDNDNNASMGGGSTAGEL